MNHRRKARPATSNRNSAFRTPHCAFPSSHSAFRIPHSAFLTLLLCTAAFGQSAPEKPGFSYDEPAQTIRGELLADTEAYDPDVVFSGQQGWLVWLRFVPGQGDQIWLASSRAKAWGPGHRLLPADENAAGMYSAPTLTSNSAGQVWLTFEEEIGGQWHVRASVLDVSDPANVRLGELKTVGRGIYHRAAAAPDGGLWIAWQTPRDGQFDVAVCGMASSGPAPAEIVSRQPHSGDWHPDIAASSDGTVCVVWDAFDGDSFNVYARRRRGGEWGDLITIADSPTFEGRARVAIDAMGRTWLLWEEGGENWGRPYRARMSKDDPKAVDFADARGPVHRFRRLRLGLLDDDGRVRLVEPALPMPAFEQLRRRTDVPDGIRDMGGFYERGELTADVAGRPWVVYRHYCLPWLGTTKITHVQQDWGVYARCLTAGGWSHLFRFDIGQGDGLQRLSVSPLPNGLAAVWTTGRTDRREPDSPHGIATATVHAPGRRPIEVHATPRPAAPPARVAAERPVPAPATAGGETFELFFGDLHRHTDLSLCYVPVDGTMDDAYRYAIDVARLDFLGITDHSRDLARGNALSQLWWRCRKEVARHALAPRFFPLFAYERSRGGEDHNVISLRPDMLRPYTYPHPEFFKELDEDTFTIPHQTITQPIPPSGELPLGLTPATWDYRDDARRPLFEIYQGCRDRAIERDANMGLSRGHLFGFIASSDHLSTSASYAGVWSPRRDQESIFRAMQARRTFGATDRIRLVVTAGDHWMGERIAAASLPPVRIEADGTADIESVDVILNGQIETTLTPRTRRVSLTWTPPPLAAGIHYCYIRLRQSDGNQAWSSPIWVEIRPK